MNLAESDNASNDNDQGSVGSQSSVKNLARQLSDSIPKDSSPTDLIQFVPEGSKSLPISEQAGDARKRPAEHSSGSQKKAKVTEAATTSRVDKPLAFDTGLLQYGQAVCQKMVDYQGKGNLFFAHGNEGSVDQTCFETLDAPFSWRVREGVKASEALRAFFSGPSAIECGVFLVACQLDALREYLGDDLFNQHFGDGTDQPPLTGRLELRPDLYEIESLRSKTNLDVLGEQEGIHVGQKVYLSNTPRYSFRHPYGVAQGENLAYLGNNTYVGFGLGPQVYTLDQVQEVLFQSYAASRHDNEVAFIDELIKNPDLTPRQVQNFKSEEQVGRTKEEIIGEMELSLGLMLIPSRFLS